MCDLDDGYGKLRDKVDDQKEQSLKLSEQLEFASDYCLGIHHGLIEIGGHSHSGPSADMTRRMFTLERGNIISQSVMGTERYMAMIRSAGYGIDRFAEATDPAEGEESEHETIDVEVDPTPSMPTVRRSIQLLVNNLRDRQNEMLENEEFRHAAMFQHVVIQALDVLGGSAPVDMEALMRLKTLARDVLMMISSM